MEEPSMTTVQDICDIAPGHNQLLLNHSTETGHSFEVYKVWGVKPLVLCTADALQPMEAFEETNGKTGDRCVIRFSLL